MAIKHRYIDKDIWKQKWFRSLEPKDKAFYMYLISHCDHAGIYSHDPGSAAFYIGEMPSDLSIFDNRFRMHNIDHENWLLLDFLKLQYPKGIDGVSAPLFSVRKLLFEHQLLEVVRQALGKGFLSLKDKEIKKEIELYKLEGKVPARERVLDKPQVKDNK